MSGRTVRVRVAVAVEASGNWTAWGAADTDDDEAIGNVYEPGDVVYFLEAEVPVPEPAEPITIPATVSEAP